VVSGDGDAGRRRAPSRLGPVTFSPAEAEALAARVLAGLTTSLAEPQIDHARRVAAAVEGYGDQRLAAAGSGPALPRVRSRPSRVMPAHRDGVSM
jgi:hypothetical protein